MYEHTGIKRGSTLAPLLYQIDENKMYTNKKGKIITLEFDPQNQCNRIYDNDNILFTYSANHLPIIFTCTPSSFLLVDEITDYNIYTQLLFPNFSYTHDIEYVNKRKTVFINKYDTPYTITNEGQQKREYIDYLVLRAFDNITHFKLDFRLRAWTVPDRFIIEYPAGTIRYDSKWIGSKQSVENNPHLYPEGWGGLGDQRCSIDIPFNHKYAHVVVKVYTKEYSDWSYTISANPISGSIPLSYYSIPITLYNIYESTKDTLFVGTYFNTYNLYSMNKEKSGVFHINPKNCMVNHDLLYLNDALYKYDNKLIFSTYYPNTHGSVLSQEASILIQQDHIQNYNILTNVNTFKTCIFGLPDYYFYFYNFSQLYYYNQYSTLMSDTFYQNVSLHKLFQEGATPARELPFILYIDNEPISVYPVDTLTIEYLKNKEIWLKFIHAVKDFRILPYVQSKDTILYRPYVDVGESIRLVLPDCLVPYEHPLNGLQIAYFAG